MPELTLSAPHPFPPGAAIAVYRADETEAQRRRGEPVWEVPLTSATVAEDGEVAIEVDEPGRYAVCLDHAGGGPPPIEGGPPSYPTLPDAAGLYPGLYPWVTITVDPDPE